MFNFLNMKKHHKDNEIYWSFVVFVSFWTGWCKSSVQWKQVHYTLQLLWEHKVCSPLHHCWHKNLTLNNITVQWTIIFCLPALLKQSFIVIKWGHFVLCALCVIFSLHKNIKASLQASFVLLQSFVPHFHHPLPKQSCSC